MFDGSKDADVLSMQSLAVGEDVCDRVEVVAGFDWDVEQTVVGGEITAAVQL